MVPVKNDAQGKTQCWPHMYKVLVLTLLFEVQENVPTIAGRTLKAASRGCTSVPPAATTDSRAHRRDLAFLRVLQLNVLYQTAPPGQLLAKLCVEWATVGDKCACQ